MIKKVKWSSCEVPVILVRFLMKLHFLERFSKNTQILNLIQMLSAEAELFHALGQTDMAKLIVAFRNSANAPKNRKNYE